MDKILFLGDSLTDCERLYSRDGLGEGYVKILSGELPYRLINSGFNGFTAADINRRLNIFLQSKPKYISLLVGVNDVPSVMECGAGGFERFKQSYADILSKLSSYRENTLIMLPFIFTTPAEFIMWQRVLKSLNAEIRNICRKQGFKNILDTEKIFGEKEAALGSEALTTDGIHLTEAGHKILAEHWLEFFRNAIEKNA